jgi:hypothetical protein
MDRTINYFSFDALVSPNWDVLKTRFPRNISRFNIPFFLAGSDEERRFLAFCEGEDLRVIKRTVVEYLGSCLDSTCEQKDKFLYLCLKSDEAKCIPDERPGFVDYSSACPGGGSFAICDRGARQVKTAVIQGDGASLISELDFVITEFPLRPSIFILSPRLKSILSDLSPTGCEITPCEVVPKSTNQVGSAECYQLEITMKTPGPAQIGKARIGSQCPNCGVVGGFSSDTERYFRPADIASVDFQTCDLYEATNIGQFHILSPFPIVSQRIFDVLLANKVKGLLRYATDPPIKHAVVQIK